MFSNSCIRSKSNVAYFSSFIGLCLEKVSECIKLFELIWDFPCFVFTFSTHVPKTSFIFTLRTFVLNDQWIYSKHHARDTILFSKLWRKFWFWFYKVLDFMSKLIEYFQHLMKFVSLWYFCWVRVIFLWIVVVIKTKVCTYLIRMLGLMNNTEIFPCYLHGVNLYVHSNNSALIWTEKIKYLT